MQAEQDILQGNKQLDLAGRQLGMSGVGTAGSMLQQQQQFPVTIAAGMHDSEANRQLQLAIANANRTSTSDVFANIFGTAAGIGLGSLF